MRLKNTARRDGMGCFLASYSVFPKLFRLTDHKTLKMSTADHNKIWCRPFRSKMASQKNRILPINPHVLAQNKLSCGSFWPQKVWETDFGKHWFNLIRNSNNFIFFRNPSLRPSGMDHLSPLRGCQRYRLVLGHPPLRHDLRRHPLWDGRTDLLRPGSAFPDQGFGRLQGPD